MDKKQQKPKSDELSFKPVIKYLVIFYTAILITTVILFSALSVTTMKHQANAAIANAKTDIEFRLEQTIDLLTSLSNDPYFQDLSISYVEKTKRLEQYSEQFNYMMICIVDSDINVYNVNGTKTSLASRKYMQQMFSSGKPQVTDSFPAGRDGKTLNYTIAVPILQDGKTVSGLFAAIYFGEMEELLKATTTNSSQILSLFGAENQVMSNSKGDKYGSMLTETLNGTKLFGTTTQQLDNNFYNCKSGSFSGIKGLNPIYTAYTSIAGTNWTLACKSSFFATLWRFTPQILIMILSTTLLCLILAFFSKRYVNSQMGTVKILIDSVEELEKKIYQNEKPDNVDFHEIINLTSKGLSDGLTGVITRTVFINQLPNKIKALESGKLGAVCFIDVDNLKEINDSYGHSIGDMTLKTVGYILREYEKKYDGLVGRHGGDEFILFMTDIESNELLISLLQQLITRLHSSVSTGNSIVPIQCSMGVSICDSQNNDAETLITNADQALYFAKQHGKGSYKLFNEIDNQEES